MDYYYYYSGYLPEELVILILERLSPASSLRFRSVCKSWRCILSAPGFLERSILLLGCPNRDQKSLIIIEDGNEHKAVGLIDPSSSSPTELAPPPRPPGQLHNDFMVVGSCRGIVCLAAGEQSEWLALWNPSNGESRVLPDQSTRLDPHSYDFLAFGYSDGDFKVVKITGTWRFTTGHGHIRCYRTWIYELDSDSWREIISPIGIGSDKCLVPLMNNKSSWRDGSMCSWITYDLRQNKYGIISFDMTNESFTQFSSVFPIPIDSSLLTLNGLLAVCCRKSVLKHPVLADIWVLLHHDVAESWTKLWSIQLGPDTYLPLEFWNGGLVLKRDGDEDRLLWYDLSIPQGLITLPVACTGRRNSAAVAFEKTHASLASVRKPKKLKKRMTDEESLHQ